MLLTQRSFFIYILFSMVFTIVNGQGRTNSWINYDNTYIKFGIEKNGIYRIPKSKLVDEGVDVGGINDATYQLYRDGQEVPIYVTSDYIEFWGEGEKGNIDVPLYEKPEYQKHQGNSLYSNEGIYFLTWGDKNGLRFQSETGLSTSNLAKIETHKRTQNAYYKTNFYLGSREVAFLLHPRMGDGEMMMSRSINKRGDRIYYQDFNVQDCIDGDSISVSGFVQGLSDRTGRWSADGFNQHCRIDVLTDQGWTKAWSKLWKGFKNIEIGFKVAKPSNGELKLRVVGDRTYKDLGNAFKTLFCVSHLSLNYNSSISGQQHVENLHFNFSSNTNGAVDFKAYSSSDSFIMYTSDSRYMIFDQNTIVELANNSSEIKGAVVDSIRSIKSFEKLRISKSNFSAATNFLIISHSSLAQGATEYKKYRESASGGGYNVTLIYADSLYDEFYYGYHHPLAIEKVIDAIENTATQTVATLILGKGLSLKNIYDGKQYDFNQDLVPCKGYPPSDYLYLTKDGDYTNFKDLTIGRVSANTNVEITNYFQKVKNYESLQSSYWRKGAIHVGGGKNEEEQKRFRNYMLDFSRMIEQPQLGYNTIYFGKDDGLTSSENLTESIIEQVDNGASLFSYFGHAGANITEVDLGLPNDYNNSQRPIFMYFGGCVLGNCFENSQSLGEQFLLSPNGALMWVAAGTFSFERDVLNYTQDFYKEINTNSYGKNIGEQQLKTIENFIIPGNEYIETQALLTLLQGDPSLILYAPELADYAITGSQIYISPDGLTTQDDSLTVNIVAQNRGRAIEDSFKTAVEITFPDGKVQADTFLSAAIYNEDTLKLTLALDNSSFGEGSLRVLLDPDNEINEFNESNNSANTNFTIFSNGVEGLFPPNYAIVSDNNIEIVAQALDLNSENNTFYFELDTTPDFNSNYKISSGAIVGGVIKTWGVELLDIDSLDYYWRVRLQFKDGNFTPWKSKTFSQIKRSNGGWGQVSFNQLKNNKKKDIYNEQGRTFQFVNSTSPGSFRISNHGSEFPVENNYAFGDRRPRASDDAKRISSNQISQVSKRWTFNGMTAFAVNPRINDDGTFNAYSARSDYSQMGDVLVDNDVYTFDWMESENSIDPEVLDSFISFLNQIPEGYHVLMYSGYFHRIEDMPNRFYRALEQFGSGKIRELQNRDVWLMIGSKGLQPGNAHAEELTSSQDTLLFASHSFIVTKNRGHYETERIGPSKKWRKLDVTTKRNVDSENGEVFYSLIGINKNNQRKTLVEKFEGQSLDLSFINAQEYPYIALKLNTFNPKTLEPAQPKSWIIHYDYLPEGLVTSELAFKFESDTLQRGQNLEFEIGYENVSNLSLDDIIVQYEIYDDDRNRLLLKQEPIEPLGPGQSTILRQTFSTDSLLGTNRLIVRTNPDQIQPELYSFNNNFESAFYVKGDFERPSLNVSFDGNTILNGDIISPKPTITIVGEDNNEFFLLNDPSYFEVYLTYPDSILPVKLTTSSQGFNFTPATEEKKQATISYTPATPLPDGEYNLTVQLNDAAGNKSGKIAYDVNFEVVGKSSITNFYPYPNPFSTSMHFVFTLTGQDIPDDIVIQIMTVNGKVVKEINKSDLGPLKIGHNLSPYTWDGTDMFGNKLANGVYIYRVKTVINGKTVEHRNSAGDQAFNGEFGKLYILR